MAYEFSELEETRIDVVKENNSNDALIQFDSKLV
jgi:hypothetical protein